jgi:transposase
VSSSVVTSVQRDPEDVADRSEADYGGGGRADEIMKRHGFLLGLATVRGGFSVRAKRGEESEPTKSWGRRRTVTMPSRQVEGVGRTPEDGELRILKRSPRSL